MYIKIFYKHFPVFFSFRRFGHFVMGSCSMNNHYKRQSVSPCFSGLLNLIGAFSSTTFHVRVWIAPSASEAVYLVTLSPEESIAPYWLLTPSRCILLYIVIPQKKELGVLSRDYKVYCSNGSLSCPGGGAFSQSVSCVSVAPSPSLSRPSSQISSIGD